ncbi:MAG: DUF3047 domain-containing protein [Pseudomonadota bacterium]
MVSFFLFSRNIKLAVKVCLCFLSFLFSPADIRCQDLADKYILIIGNFSAEKSGVKLPTGWEPLLFEKIENQTLYSLVADNGNVVVKATSYASASGLIRKTSINRKEYKYGIKLL